MLFMKKNLGPRPLFLLTDRKTANREDARQLLKIAAKSTAFA
jgi:hypothetical protein